jgi:lactoylglutathione lyase
MVKPTGLHVFLNVTNIEKSAAFYEGLGFKRTAQFPPPMNVYGYSMGTPGSDLLLGPAEGAQDAETRSWLATRPLGAGVVIMPQVKDVDAVFENAKRIGAEIEQPPTDQPWGARTLMIADPDGYSLMFDQATTRPRAARKAPARKAKAAKKATAKKGTTSKKARRR